MAHFQAVIPQSFNWERHFREISRRQRKIPKNVAPTVRLNNRPIPHMPTIHSGHTITGGRGRGFNLHVVEFGTTLTGDYSVDDLKDLIKAKDENVTRLQASYLDLTTKTAIDSTLQSAWMGDFAKLQGNYGNAKARAQVFMKLIPDAASGLTSAQTPYRDILGSLNALWESHGIAPGSLDDLSNRLIAMGGKTDQSPLPQPTAQDYGLMGYKVADEAVKGIEGMAKQAGQLPSKYPIATIALVVVGIVAASTFLGISPLGMLK